MKQITSTTVEDGQLMKKIVNLKISIYPGSVNLTAFLTDKTYCRAVSWQLLKRLDRHKKKEGSRVCIKQIHLVVVFSVEYSKMVCSIIVVAVPHTVKFLFHCIIHPL